MIAATAAMMQIGFLPTWAGAHAFAENTAETNRAYWRARINNKAMVSAQLKRCVELSDLQAELVRRVERAVLSRNR